MKKNFVVLLCLIIVGCSNLSFNERYYNVGWGKVIIAPFTGDFANIAETEFEHALGISSKLLVVTSSMTLTLLSENNLSKLYSNEPYKALFILAEKINAQGVVFGKVSGTVPVNGSRGSITLSSAEIYVKLVDVASNSIVASSHHKSSSVLSVTGTLIQDVSLEAIDDFYQYFTNITN
ncbi:MAG: hypothetical protein JKY81_13220 [Colwellia sp.]|nr:hypothetical protein [Colwellia sp.]